MATSSTKKPKNFEAPEVRIEEYLSTLDNTIEETIRCLRSFQDASGFLKIAQATMCLAEDLLRRQRYMFPSKFYELQERNFKLTALAEINEMLRNKAWPQENSAQLSPRLEQVLWYDNNFS